jgi:hypothetical protein
LSHVCAFCRKPGASVLDAEYDIWYCDQRCHDDFWVQFSRGWKSKDPMFERLWKAASADAAPVYAHVPAADAPIDPMVEKAWTLMGDNEELKALIRYNPLWLPEKDLRRMVQACHPDKHGGSEVASEVTAWLMRKRMAGAAT